MNIDFKAGEKIYVLVDYVLHPAVVVSARGPKTLLVDIPTLDSSGKEAPYRMRVKREKCVWPYERIAIVWEMWKGRNGRGGYRIERTRYADERRDAHTWHNEKAWNYIQEDVEPE